MSVLVLDWRTTAPGGAGRLLAGGARTWNGSLDMAAVDGVARGGLDGSFASTGPDANVSGAGGDTPMSVSCTERKAGGPEGGLGGVEERLVPGIEAPALDAAGADGCDDRCASEGGNPSSTAPRGSACVCVDVASSTAHRGEPSRVVGSPDACRASSFFFRTGLDASGSGRYSGGSDATGTRRPAPLGGSVIRRAKHTLFRR
jgi:hypothetical protein